MKRGRPKNPPPPTPRECLREYTDLLRHGLSLIEAGREIEKTYGHDPKSMRSAFRRHNGEEETTRHGHCLLSNENEEAIVGLIVSFDFRGQALAPAVVKRAASAEFGVKLDASWLTRFLGRHEKELAARHKSLRPVNPTLENLPDECSRWCDTLEGYHRKYFFPPPAKLTADEARLLIKDGCLHWIRVGQRGATYSHLKWSEKDVIGSYIVFISADGVVLFAIYIFRLKTDDMGETFREFFLPNTFRSTRSSHRRFYMFTRSTYVDQKAWNAIMDTFAEVWFNLHPKLHCELYLDHLGAHAHPPTVLKARAKGIHTILLPKKSTPSVSPLDLYPYGLWRSFSTKFAEEAALNAFLRGERSANLVFPAVWKAENRAFIQDTLVAAWRDTGLHPYRRDVILGRCGELVGKPTARSGPESRCASAAGRVIDAAREPKASKMVKAPAKEGVVYNPDDLKVKVEETARKKEEEKKLALRQRETRRRSKEERDAEAAKKREVTARRKREREKVNVEKGAAKQRRAKDRARRAKAMEQAKKQHVEKIAMNTCNTRGAVWRGGKGWRECDHYEDCGFTQCPKCSKKHRADMEAHEAGHK